MKKTLLIISTITILINACKKEESTSNGNGNNGGTGCIITKEYVSDSSYSDFVYNSQNKISQITTVDNGSTRKITTSISGNQVNLLMDGNLYGTIYLNANGYSDSIKYSMFGSTNNEYFTYNSDGNVLTHISYEKGSSYSRVQSEQNIWSGGNLIQTYSNTINNGGAPSFDTTSFDYYTDITNTVEAFRNKSTFQGVASKNALKKATQGSGMLPSITTYTYVTDSDGKITQKSETYSGGSPNVTKYTWLCK